MSYKDNKIGYPSDILSNRSVIVKDNFAIITREGIVKNTIPGFDNCEMTILGSPKLGASFVDYICTMLPDGKTSQGFGGNGVETFAYVIEGEVKASDGENEYILEKDGYIFVPDNKEMHLTNISKGNSELFIYKRRYNKIAGLQAYTVVDNVKNLEVIDYEDMSDVKVWNLLPTTLEFDMNFHILAFGPGASHGYIETHVQEHGAIILSGEGLYNLDNNWIPVKTGDYIFMDSYCPQAGYSVGRHESFSYLYSKDCNRDEII